MKGGDEMDVEFNRLLAKVRAMKESMTFADLMEITGLSRRTLHRWINEEPKPLWSTVLCVNANIERWLNNRGSFSQGGNNGKDSGVGEV